MGKAYVISASKDGKTFEDIWDFLEGYPSHYTFTDDEGKTTVLKWDDNLTEQTVTLRGNWIARVKNNRLETI